MNRKLYVGTVYVNSNVSVAKQLRNLLRGQWVFINGMMARVINHTGNRVVLWMNNDRMPAVFA